MMDQNHPSASSTSFVPSSAALAAMPVEPEFLLIMDFEASGVIADSKDWEIVEFPIVVVQLVREASVSPAPSHLSPRGEQHTRSPKKSKRWGRDRQSAGDEQQSADMTIGIAATAAVPMEVDTEGATPSAPSSIGASTQIQKARILPVQFQSFVRPTRNPQLSPQCIKNCGIEQTWVDAAPDIGRVVGMADAFVQKLFLNAPANYSNRVLVVTCGDYDLGTAIRAEAECKSLEMPGWLRRWCNIKRAFEESSFGSSAAAVKGQAKGNGRKGEEKGTGMKGRCKKGSSAWTMKSMLERMGLSLDGSHHRGIDDAANIAKIVCKLFESGEGNLVRETGRW